MQLNELHAFCVYGVHGCYAFSMGFFYFLFQIALLYNYKIVNYKLTLSILILEEFVNQQAAILHYLILLLKANMQLYARLDSKHLLIESKNSSAL